MPNYDYICPKCGPFELLVSIAKRDEVKCPKCSQDSKRQPAKGGGVVFKGTGFYETDYKTRPGDNLTVNEF